LQTLGLGLGLRYQGLGLDLGLDTNGLINITDKNPLSCGPCWSLRSVNIKKFQI